MKAKMISILFIAILTIVSTIPGVAAAASATRDLPSDCVDPDTEFTVTISASGYGAIGEVSETLCAGWTYTGTSLQSSQVEVDGNTVTFYLLGDSSFTYTVQAPDVEGECCTISGTLKDQGQNSYTVGGDYEVCVCTDEVGPSATRDLPSDCVDPDTEFTVTISASNYGAIGEVSETLCAGWTYTGTSLQSSQVEVDGNTVTFYLLGESSFTYTVQAPDVVGECCTISGTLEDQGQNPYTVGGDYDVCVCTDEVGPSATRDLPQDCVDPDTEFTVTISASNYGAIGEVSETLCAGWTYTGTSLQPSQVEVDGNTVTFYLLGDSSFTYTVQAPDVVGECCTISGTLKDQGQNPYTVGGYTQVCTCSLDNPRPRITDPSDGATVSGIITIVEEDLSGQDDIVYNLFEYRPVSGTTWTEIGNDTNGSDGWWVLWNTKAVANGSYYIRATMGDNESLTGSDQIFVTVDNPPQYGISLESGWNFISVPCVLDNDTVEHVLDGVDYEAIVEYDPCDQTWYIPSYIVPLTAYGIKVNDENQVIENIECKIEFGLPNSIQMCEGWNPVGLTGFVPKTAEFTFKLGDIDDNYSKVWGPYEDGDYTQHGFNQNVFGDIPGGEVPPDVYTENYIMEPYQGHWIYMTSDAVLSAIA